VHTSEELNISDFSLTVEGRSAAVVDLFPGFSRTARLAIVSRTPGGAFGAATTVLALVTAWYDELRRGVDEFFEYPDFFHLQLGDGGLADLGGLEIWPPHKQVALPARAQDVLAAIADRAVEYLLVEDGPLGSALVLRETKNSLPRHLRAAVVYGADGMVESSDVTVTGSTRSERHVIHAIDESVDLPADRRAALRDLRQRLSAAGSPTEELRRIGLGTAVAMLCPLGDSRANAPWGVGGMTDDALAARLVQVGAAET
jgi:hypothetical protein